MVFTQIWYLHKQGLQDQNKGITNCAEFILLWRNYPICGGSNESSKIPGLYPLCFVICSVIHFKILLFVPKCPIRSLDLVTITILCHLFGCFRYALLSFLCLAKKQEENVIHITTFPGVFVLRTMPGEIPRNKTCGWVFAVYGEYANRHKNEPISANFRPIPKKFSS
jgi:hypothetical protein